MTRIHKYFSIILLIAFAAASWSQETPPAETKPAEAAKDATPKFSATLLLIKSDWSKSPHAKEIEAELREALKDAAVPQKLLDKLPASGPQILFAPEIAAIYGPEHYAELRAWLKEKDLIVGEEYFPPPTIDRKATDSGLERLEKAKDFAKSWFEEYDTNGNDILERDEWPGTKGTKMASPAVADKNKDDRITVDELVTTRAQVDAATPHRAVGSTKLSKDKKFMELPPPPPLRTPFTKRRIDLSWTIDSQYGKERLKFTRECSFLDEVRGQPPGEPQVYDDGELHFPVPLDQIAIINGFPGNTGSVASFRTAAQNKGFHVLISVAGERAAVSDTSGAKPRLHLPDIVETFSGGRPEKSVAWQPAVGKDSDAEPKVSASGVPAEGKPKADVPFTATLVQVKSDWSKVPAAKEIGAELREALKEAPVPKELMDQLPASGPQILFAPEIVSLYTNEHFAELMAWLKTKGLVVEESRFEPQKPPSKTDAQANMWGTSIFSSYDKNNSSKLEKEEWQQMTYYAAADTDKDETITPEEFAAFSQLQAEIRARNTRVIKRGETFIDLPLPKAVRSQPFVVRRPELTWSITSQENLELLGAGQVTHSFSRNLAVKEEVRGRPSLSKWVDNSVTGFNLPDRHVAVINAFPARTEAEYRAAANKKGFEAVIVVTRTDSRTVPTPSPRLHLPDQIDVALVSHEVERQQLGEINAAATLPAPDESLTKIFHLQNASASKLRDVVLQIAPGEIRLAVDERTNALIVSGSEGTLAELEAILLRLDEPDSTSEEKLPPQPAGTVAKLKQQYAGAEQEATRLANEAKPQKDKLRAAVAKAFELRQLLLQAELTEFRQRTERIQQSLMQREGIKQQIIERRVEDLLKPGSKWDPADGEPSAERRQ